MEWLCFKKQGLVHTKSWVIDRYIANHGIFGYTLRRALDTDLYPDENKEPNDEIFQEYWRNVTLKNQFRSQWDENRYHGHCGVLFDNRRMIDYYYDYDRLSGANRAIQNIKSQLENNSGSKVEFGIISTICQRGEPTSHPGFTLVVSGPQGGSEAVQIFKEALKEYGIIGGVFLRSTEYDRHGVLQAVFSTKWYVYQEQSSFGIDWNRWSLMSQHDFESHYFHAMLYWTDFIIFALRDLITKAGLFIDGVYMDSFKVLEYSNCSPAKIINDLSGQLTSADLQ